MRGGWPLTPAQERSSHPGRDALWSCWSRLRSLPSLQRSPQLEVAVWAGCGAGLRLSETLGLLTSRVNFLRRTIRVEQQLQRSQLVEPKTDASRRTVPVDDFVVQKIAAHLECWPSDGLLITQAGRPVHRSTFGDHWRAAVKKAGLPPTPYHSLRHFYASALIRNGMNVKTVQQRMGHSSATITLDIYAHLFGDDLDRGRGAVR